MDIMFLEWLEKTGQINDPVDPFVIILLIFDFLLLYTGFLMVLIGSAQIARNKMQNAIK